MKRGFTLIEVLVSSIMLTIGLIAVLQLFMQSQRMMMSSARFETAQRVLNYFDMVHPIPQPDQVTDDPLQNDLLNIGEVKAEELASELELDLTRADREMIKDYTVQRSVDDIDDEELQRNGEIYTVRTVVKWGGDNYGRKRGEDGDSETVIRLWWKGAKTP